MEEGRVSRVIKDSVSLCEGHACYRLRLSMLGFSARDNVEGIHIDTNYTVSLALVGSCKLLRVLGYGLAKLQTSALFFSIFPSFWEGAGRAIQNRK